MGFHTCVASFGSRSLRLRLPALILILIVFLQTETLTFYQYIRAKINSAARAFGALSKCIFQSKHVKRDAKRAVYERLILSICLYGCESWCLKETLSKELRQFHARCVRNMSRTNLHHTWIHRISTKNLEKELGLDSMNNYIARRQLRWLGQHVSRMPFDRLPRRMRSSWFPAPRCTGATKMTYGRTMKKTMANGDFRH